VASGGGEGGFLRGGAAELSKPAPLTEGGAGGGGSDEGEEEGLIGGAGRLDGSGSDAIGDVEPNTGQGAAGTIIGDIEGEQGGGEGGFGSSGEGERR